MLTSRLVVGLVGLFCTVEAIWPVPKTITTGEDVLFIHQNVAISCNGAPITYTANYTPEPGPQCDDAQIVQAGVSRAMGAIFEKNFVPWMLNKRHSDFEPHVGGDMGSIKWVKTLKITYDTRDNSTCYKPLAGEVDESYTLNLSSEGDAEITAKSAIGVLRGLATFIQLFYQHSTGTFWYTKMAPVAIEDAPQFPYRGVMLDVARSFYPVEDIKRTIDGIAMNKMNRLHIHATDSQSWPLEIPSMPELAEKGAYRAGMSYSPADVQMLQEYGSHQGVEVIIEIDMPGHIGSVALSHPELIVAYNEIPYQWWCLEPPCGAFKMNDSAVPDFIGKLFDDLLPRLTPYSSIFHLGGDELYPNDTMIDDGVNSNDTKVLSPLLQQFIDINYERVRKAGLTPMMWADNLLDPQWDVEFGKDIIMQTWTPGQRKNATALGYKVVESNYEYLYMDCGRGQWLDFDDDAYSQFWPFNDWCGPTKSWRKVWSIDLYADLTEEEKKLVLGGEVAVWSETIDPVNLDSLLWPRGAAAAENFWSGRQDASGQNRTQWDASPRLADMRERMLASGIKASPVQMTFCTQADDPRECAYDVSPYN